MGRDDGERREGTAEGYHLVDPEDLDQWDDRDVDVRSVSVAAGLDYQGSPLGLRVYEARPGQQLPLAYHYHDEQVEAFVVCAGRLHVETPSETFTVETGQVFLVHPGNPHRAYNPADADGPVRVVAVGAPSADDAHVYDPDGEGDETAAGE